VGAPSISKVSVSTTQELESTIMSYLAQGYTVGNRTQRSATLQKKKEFSVLWAVIGFLVCVLPLLIYLIVYATKPDMMIVEISVTN
jgi:ABC-type Fe3+ transport system permease subunit